MNNEFYFQVPFAKVDKERRVVIGVATADNIDKADDIVDFDASVEAFDNWIGNIREMHGPKAVGKALSYKTIDFVDDSGQTYRGIEVEAYVSKGAEDTWQKVLDGTLTGFSIGGMVEKVKPEYHTTVKKMIRRIVKYSLGELSLVDNPCNPAAQISVVKSYNGTLMYDLEDEDTQKADRNPRSDRLSATPAPTKDRVSGSDTNEEGSASSSSSGSDIELSESIINSLKSKIIEHNDAVSDKESWRKASLSSLKSVYRRGAGAYSVSHRPGMTRGQWAMARVNAFLTLLRTGKPSNPRYITDNDLLPAGHPAKGKSASNDIEKAESFTPPDGVQAEARRALEWIKEGHAGQGFTDVGRRRASQLANGQPVSLATIKRMSSYLARHEVDKQGKGWSPGSDGYPSPGRVAWAAWGGDPAIGWTNKILRSANAMNKVARAELEYVDAMLEIVDEYGKLADDDGNGIWVGYVEPENNDNLSIGVQCAHCYFYMGDGECSIVAQKVDPEGYCRLAAIASKDIVDGGDGGDMNVDMSMMTKSENCDIFFCKDCGIATYHDEQCNVCKNSMVFIGTVSNFDYDNVSKMIDNFMKGGVKVEDLQKNENNDNITNMEQDSVTISAAAADLIAKVASSMVPSFHIFTTDGSSVVIDKGYKMKDEEEKSDVEDDEEDMMKSVIGASNLPIADRSRTWDGTAAERRVRAMASSDGSGDPETIDWEVYSKAFFYRDENMDRNSFSAYKLNFADVIDGDLVAVPRGLFAVAGVLEGARGGVDVPMDQQETIKTKVNGYYKRMSNQFDDEGLIAPWQKGEISAEELSAVEESFEGGEDVNTEELLKSLTELIDGKLTEFKEDFSASVDEKIDTAVTKSREIKAEADEALEKSEEVEVEVNDEKDELIKSLTDRIERLEATGAVKKSLDDDTTDDDGEVITKSTGSVWDGYFIPAEVVHALGYES